MPSNLISVYEKNKIDLSFGVNVVFTITDGVATADGSDTVNYLRDRINYTGFATTGSNDAANTQIDIDMGDAYNINFIALVRQNFAAYTLQYYNGVSYVDFSTPINESGLSVTDNSEQTKVYNFTQVNAQLLRLIITGCYPVDADKVMRQLIVTRKIGEFVNQPSVRPLQREEFRQIKPMVSGRRHISKRQGAHTARLTFPSFKNQSDINLIENIFDSTEGRLFNFSGAQDLNNGFKTPGFRPEDFYLMAPTNNFNTSFTNGRFADGVAPVLDLVEVV